MQNAPLSNENYNLPLLEEIFNYIPLNEKLIFSEQLSHMGLVSVQHLLPTTVSLFCYLNKFGLPFQHVHVLGKSYSTVDGCTEQLQRRGVNVTPITHDSSIGLFEYGFQIDIQELLKRFELFLKEHPNVTSIIVLDDGGRLAQLIPKDIKEKYKIVFIEQTTAGSRKIEQLAREQQLEYPAISVARSDAKKLEAKSIADTFEGPLFNLPIFTQGGHKKSIIGVVGNGTIGKAIRAKLIARGYMVVLLDYENFKSTSGDCFLQKEAAIALGRLVLMSDVVVGCTGADIFKIFSKMHWNISKLIEEIIIRKNTYFVSVSSERKELTSLLYALDEMFPGRKTNSQHSLAIYSLNDHDHEHGIGIANGGAPVNFTGTASCDPPERFQLTRSLLLGAVLMSLRIFSVSKGSVENKLYALDHDYQRFVISKWITMVDSAAYDGKALIEFFNGRGEEWSARLPDNLRLSFFSIVNPAPLFIPALSGDTPDLIPEGHLVVMRPTMFIQPGPVLERCMFEHDTIPQSPLPQGEFCATTRIKPTINTTLTIQPSSSLPFFRMAVSTVERSNDAVTGSYDDRQSIYYYANRPIRN